MTNIPKKPNPRTPSEASKPQLNSPVSKSTQEKSQSTTAVNTQTNIVKMIKDAINHEEVKSLKNYSIRNLVNHAKDFGYYLKAQKLETNQIRKFLDAVNQIKTRLAQDEDGKLKQIQEQAEVEKEKIRWSEIKEEEKNNKIQEIQVKLEAEQEKIRFSKIEIDVVLLKPKLAYAAARQSAAKSLNEVMSLAIDKVHSTEDFYRLVQFIESIIAYHKEAGSWRE